MKRAVTLLAFGLAMGIGNVPAEAQAREYVGRLTHHKHAHAVTQTKQSQAAITPQIALDMMKAGNERFVAAKSLRRDYRAQVRATSAGQYPFATVLGCIDSRAAPELVFDQGIGDLFAPRIAGNFVNDDILGSMEFAAKVAGSRLIVVLGHTQCGAIKGACDGAKLGNLTQMLEKLQPAVDGVPDDGSPRNSKNASFVQKVADHNVQLTVEEIKRRSAVLREMAEKGEIMIVGAMYDIATGKVQFLD